MPCTSPTFRGSLNKAWLEFKIESRAANRRCVLLVGGCASCVCRVFVAACNSKRVCPATARSGTVGNALVSRISRSSSQPSQAVPPALRLRHRIALRALHRRCQRASLEGRAGNLEYHRNSWRRDCEIYRRDGCARERIHLSLLLRSVYPVGNWHHCSGCSHIYARIPILLDIDREVVLVSPRSLSDRCR
jgi:hypothetical protein